MNFHVNDLVCLIGARTQEVLTVTETIAAVCGTGTPLIICGDRAFTEDEIEPKPIQEGDCVRDVDNVNRFEAALVDASYIELIRKDGHRFTQYLKESYRAVARVTPETAASEDEEPSFRIGDLVQEKGDEEGDLFTVVDLTDDGHTVILAGGLEMQHTALEPAALQVGNWVRGGSGNLRDQVRDIVGDAVYFDGYFRASSECRRVSSAWPCEEEAPTTQKERTLAKVLADLRRTDAKLLELRAHRKALKKEARSAFAKALKVGV